MNTLTETGRLLEDTAQKIFASHCSADALKASEGDWSASLWDALEEAELPFALEPAGGELGLAPADALNLVRLAGWFAAPVPLPETLLATFLVASTGLQKGGGPLTVVGLNSRDALRLERSGTAWSLSGIAHRTPWARYCTLIGVVEQGGRTFIARIDPQVASMARGENMAREPRDTVTLATSAVVAESPYSRRHLRAFAAGLRALQLTGAMERVLDLTVGYALERVQFGRAIGKFQAIQQNIAIMGGQVAAARAGTLCVASALTREELVPALAAAKIRAGEAASTVARHAHQVHGAIGFTQDYELHFFTKRLWSWRDEFGSEAHWSRFLGYEACSVGGDDLWAFITNGLARV